MAVYSGRRDAGLWVLNEIMSADPDAFSMMTKEANDRSH